MEIDIAKAAVVLQLYDNSVYMVSGTGGTKHLPTRDIKGVYHMEGELVLADKSGIKDLTKELVPLVRVLGGAKNAACHCWPITGLIPAGNPPLLAAPGHGNL